MPHVMLDLETLGTGPDAMIASIGAQIFYPGVESSFHARIVLNSDSRASIEPEAIQWWMEQSDDAREELTKGPRMSIRQALLDFSNWIPEDAIIWSNGASFDLVVLASAFRRNGLPVPWAFWNERDVRTVVDLGRSMLGIDPKKTLPPEATQHNALADAQFQARYVSVILRELDRVCSQNLIELRRFCREQGGAVSEQDEQDILDRMKRRARYRIKGGR